MHAFTDTEHRTWSLNMTIGAVKRVRAGRQVNLLDPLGDAHLPEPPQPPLLTRIHTDVELLIDVIWLMVKPEADRLGVTDLEFAEALGGDAAYAAYVAFMDEWRDFFRRLHRETEVKAIEAHHKFVMEDDQRRVALIPRVTEAAINLAERDREKAIRKIEGQTEPKIEAPGPSETATGSPASPESTPMG